MENSFLQYHRSRIGERTNFMGQSFYLSAISEIENRVRCFFFFFFNHLSSLHNLNSSPCVRLPISAWTVNTWAGIPLFLKILRSTPTHMTGAEFKTMRSVLFLISKITFLLHGYRFLLHIQIPHSKRRWFIKEKSSEEVWERKQNQEGQRTDH